MIIWKYRISAAPLSLKVNVGIQGKIKSITSPTHKIQIREEESYLPERKGWGRAIVVFSGSVKDMNRDFVVLIFPEEVHVPRIYVEVCDMH